MKILIVPGFGRCGTLSYREFFEGHPDINVISNQIVLRIDTFKMYLNSGYDNVVVSEPRVLNDPQHSEVWADMFQRYAPKARIVFTTRDPLDNLQAWYQSNYYDVRTKRIVSFKTFLEGMWQDRHASFLGALHPKNSFEIYKKRFEDVRVYSMIPDLQSGEAFNWICDYLGVPYVPIPLSMRHNRKAHRIRSYEYLRNFIPISFGGKVRKALEGYLSRGKRLNPKFPPGWEERLRDYYAS